MDQVVDHMSFDVVIIKFVLFKKTKNKQANDIFVESQVD